MRLLAVLVAALLLVAACLSPPAGQVLVSEISFEGIGPAGFVQKQCWNALGMDDEQRVYFGITGQYNGHEDFAVFRYDRSTGSKEFLGTLRETSQSFGNLAPDEQIPKGHTNFVQIGRRLYFGSQGFHDFKAGIDGREDFRGSHLYCYDLEDGRILDLASGLKGGVVQEHQGIIALTAMPALNLLAGLSHPLGDILLFDGETGSLLRVAFGIPWELYSHVSREIIALDSGRIYTARGTENPLQRNQRTNDIWVFDATTGRSAGTGNRIVGGYISGQAEAEDGRTVFFSTVNGELYQLDTTSDKAEHLCHFLPDEELAKGLRIEYLWGICLSRDGRKIYAIPSIIGRLYEYDLETRRVRCLA